MEALMVAYSVYCSICKTRHNMADGQTTHHTEKPCNTCGEIKPLAAFPKSGGSQDGHRHTCSACLSHEKSTECHGTQQTTLPREQTNQLLRTHGYRWRKVVHHERDEWEGDESTVEEWHLYGPDGQETTREVALAEIARSEAGAKARAITPADVLPSALVPVFPLRMISPGLPSLTGTAKQVAWAETIRSQRLRQIAHCLSEISGHFDSLPDMRVRLAWLPHIPAAGWWISHRNDETVDLLRHVVLPHARHDMKRPYAQTADAAASVAYDLLHGPTLILDTETTGLDEAARIVEVSLIRETGEVVLSTLVNPEVSIPAGAIAKHGITDSMVQAAPTFADLWPTIHGLMGSATYLAVYNAAFDMRILRRQGQEVAAQDPTMPRLAYREADDVMQCFKAFTGASAHTSLDNACRVLGIAIPGSHRALDDTKKTLELIRAMAAQGEPF
jgi:DNA polymerase III epsilon subunit-like protein